jgi:hypothetical protein
VSVRELFPKKNEQAKLRLMLKRAAESLNLKPKEPVHKRMITTTKCGDCTWQLCNSDVNFTGSEYNYTKRPFFDWARYKAKYHWKYVTCKDCLKLKEGL